MYLFSIIFLILLLFVDTEHFYLCIILLNSMKIPLFCSTLCVPLSLPHSLFVFLQLRIVNRFIFGKSLYTPPWHTCLLNREELGHGANGRAFLASSKKGDSCVEKFFFPARKPSPKRNLIIGRRCMEIPILFATQNSSSSNRRFQPHRAAKERGNNVVG